MRTIVQILCVLLIYCSPCYADIVISEVYSAGSGNTNYYGVDWFELTNTGTSDVDITGWKMDDNSNLFGSAVPFGAEVTVIAAGKSVVFLETSSANYANRVASFNNFWFGTPTSGVVIGSYNGSGVGLGTGGDQVNIFNAAGVKQASVVFGTATVGFTFDNAAGLNNTTISQLSVAGINGAIVSFKTDGPGPGTETGSPGTVSTFSSVPEPTSIALTGIGGFLALVIRRRRS
ncbi:MAG: PEP-CTERM sorting domain-containing protein [Planctomycetes bacterium]|nr:PEP-CTERM sorting domain-containing protein [Planctomycetota bacterium]